MFVHHVAFQHYSPPAEHKHRHRAIARVINALAIFGVLVLCALLIALPPVYSSWSKLHSFDDNALATYLTVGKRLLETGNPAEATVWRVQVSSGLTATDVEEAMDYIAAEHNLRRVGESNLFSSQDPKFVKSLTGVPYRYSKTLMYCNSVTAARMLHENMAYSAYTPCRISLIEDTHGRLWLYTLNIDMMIYGGKPLPEDLKRQALAVRDGIRDIMQRASRGEY